MLSCASMQAKTCYYKFLEKVRASKILTINVFTMIYCRGKDLSSLMYKTL